MNEEELLKKIKDVNSNFFGGSFAFMQISLSLIFLSKLIKIKMKKADPKMLNSYMIIDTLVNLSKKQAEDFVSKDAEYFEKLKSLKKQNEIDDFVIKTFPLYIAFLENLATIDLYLRGLIEDTHTSLKYDFIMIRDSMLIYYTNIIHIVEYMVNKSSNKDLKEEYFVKLFKLSKEIIGG